MKIVYKLTDERGQTRNRTQWGPRVSHSGTGEGELCGPGFIHYYSSPLLAVFLNPIHADFRLPRLWEAEASGTVIADRGLKYGAVTLTTIREIELPVVTLEQRIRFGILCALEVCKEPSFVKWANFWLSGEDRSCKSARRMQRAAEWAAESAKAAALAAEWAARAAAEAARSSAWSAAMAAMAAMAAHSPIDLNSLAQKAVN